MIKNPKHVYGSFDFRLPVTINCGEYLLKKLLENKTKEVINAGSKQSITFGEIAQEAMNLANSLTLMGVRKGDVVALCSENCLEFWPAIIGTICTGATLSPINWSYSSGEMKHVLNIAKPKYMICSSMAFVKNKKSFEEFNFKKTIVFGNETPNGAVSYNNTAKVTRNGLNKNVNYEDFEAAEVMGQIDNVFVLYSSGTTGLPKGVMVTHYSLLAALVSFTQPNPGPNDSTLLVTPWFHTMGLTNGLGILTYGKGLVYIPKFDVEQYLDCIVNYKITHLLVAPPILVAISKSTVKRDLSSVKIITSGAAPLFKETVEDVYKEFELYRIATQGRTKRWHCTMMLYRPCSDMLPAALGSATNIIGRIRKEFPTGKIIQGYGLSEYVMAATEDQDPDLAKAGGIGTPTPGAIIKVVDVNTREPLGPNEEGEICIKGPRVMKGYINKNKSDDFDDEEFFKTGDIGYYDHDRYFFIVDRLKELIKYKGYQVPPAEIEAILLQHEAVKDAGVVGIQDREAGEVPLAFVVLQTGKRATQDELQAFVAERLSSQKRLRGGVRFVNDIPKNPSGKILRRILRDMAKSGKSKL